MTKTRNVALPISDVERAALRRARIGLRELHTYGPEYIVAWTRGVIGSARARDLCALCELASVDGIGMALALDLRRAGFSHPHELAGMSANDVASRVEGASGFSVNEPYVARLEAVLRGLASAVPGHARQVTPSSRPRQASLDEVRIARDGEYATIEHADDQVRVTRLHVGPRLASIADDEVLRIFNDGREAEEELLRVDVPAIEIPAGSPQIEWHDASNTWTPRGNVIRCIVDCDAGQPRVLVDDKSLSWEEFGRLFLVHEGWGARIVFVHEDELNEEPHIEVCDPAASPEG